MDANNIDPMYADYEKMMPHGKLSQFLFDYFRIYYKGITWMKATGEESFYQALQFNIKKYNKYKLLTGFLDSFVLKIYSKKKPSTGSSQDKKKILFRPFKYNHIILEVKKYHQAGLLVHGNWDRLLAAKNFMGYIATSDLDQYLLAYLKEKNIAYLYQLIKKIESKLKAANPDYVVLWNDTLPMERAIILASKKLGITTLEIQHGVYDSFWPLTNGNIADYVLVWGKYFKDLYVKQGKRKPEDIYVLGYPYAIGQEVKNRNNHYVVCYLGQDLEIYNNDFLSVKLETLNSIYNICKKLDLEFVYRPHPGDDRELLKKKLVDIQFTDIKEGLEETFNRADIFISFNSTALVEAVMRQKISLQLLNYPIKSDNLEKLGACSASLQTLEELENYLKKIVSAQNLDEFKITFNNDYVETRYNPTERFLEIIKEIESKKIKI